MKMVQGSRPAAIHAFAIGFTLLGLLELIMGLSNLDQTLEELQFDLPWINWNSELVIVLHSAVFSIVLIPVVAIWIFASKIARMIIVVMSIPSLLSLIGVLWIVARGFSNMWGAALPPFLGLVCVALLFLPSSDQWLRKKEVDPETFA